MIIVIFYTLYQIYKRKCKLLGLTSVIYSTVLNRHILHGCQACSTMSLPSSSWDVYNLVWHPLGRSNLVQHSTTTIIARCQVPVAPGWGEAVVCRRIWRILNICGLFGKSKILSWFDMTFGFIIYGFNHFILIQIHH